MKETSVPVDLNLSPLVMELSVCNICKTSNLGHFLFQYLRTYGVFFWS